MSSFGARIKLHSIRRCPVCGHNDRIMKCGMCFDCYKRRQSRVRIENLKRGKNSLVKLPANAPERQFIESAEAKGWVVIRKGWPDYLCFKLDDDGRTAEIMAVEVKPSHADGLRFHQAVNCALLTEKGIDCYLYGAAEKSLRKIEGSVPSELKGRRRKAS